MAATDARPARGALRGRLAPDRRDAGCGLHRHLPRGEPRSDRRARFHVLRAVLPGLRPLGHVGPHRLRVLGRSDRHRAQPGRRGRRSVHRHPQPSLADRPPRRGLDGRRHPRRAGVVRGSARRARLARAPRAGRVPPRRHARAHDRALGAGGRPRDGPAGLRRNGPRPRRGGRRHRVDRHRCRWSRRLHGRRARRRRCGRHVARLVGRAGRARDGRDDGSSLRAGRSDPCRVDRRSGQPLRLARPEP